jgi:diaminopimelate epimerase
MRIEFTKMNGLGNDFVLLDFRSQNIALTEADIRALGNRDNPLTRGFDQLLVLRPARHGGTCYMEIFNADASRAGACGNGTRAAAAFIGAQTRQIDTIQIETDGGTLACELLPLTPLAGAQLSDRLTLVSVNMGLPNLDAADIPLRDISIDTLSVSLHAALPSACMVNMGNPHAVIFIDNQDSKNSSSIANRGGRELAIEYGETLEHHPIFPERANINFVEILNPTELRLDTWERSAGLTQACGSGACASVVAYHRRYDVPNNQFITVHLPGGDLDIRYSEDGVYMRGPAELEFSGQVDIEAEASAQSDPQSELET